MTCRGLALLLACTLPCLGQLTTGVLQGIVTDEMGAPQAGISVTIAGRPASRLTTRSDARGEFEFVLPYGEYRLSATAAVRVRPLQTTFTELVLHQKALVPGPPRDDPGTDTVTGLLLAVEPTTVSDPLEFSSLPSLRLPLVSQRAFSWTGVRFSLQGANVTDAYQPGRMVVFPNAEAVSDVVVRSGLDLATSPTYGSGIAMFSPEPDLSWRFHLSTSSTGSSLASDNLPSPATRGTLRQSEHYRWFSRNGLEAGGPLGRRADLLLATSGQWASQTVPQAQAGEDLNSRLLTGLARGRVQFTDRNQLDAQFSESHLRLSNWGLPAGLEALAGRRMSPSFTAPAGFEGLSEKDHFDSIQTGWTRQAPGSERTGVLEVRYGFSAAHLETTPFGQADAQSQIDLEAGATGGTPPLANLAARTRHGIQAVFQPGGGRRHRVVIGGGWELADVSNRWSAPSDLNLITARGAPAFVLELNTPLHSRSRIQTWSAHVQDKFRVSSRLGAEIALVGDFARGFGAQADLIAWNSISPRVGLTFSPPLLPGLILRGGYARLYGPLAGRYLDYGNSNSLGGAQYEWRDADADGIWQPSETGPLLMRFGGPYSAIDSRLRRPYADEFNLGAEATLHLGIHARLGVFRRDEKNRLAAVNVGVPEEAFSPVEILDPGPDFTPGTFDDRKLTVYAQDPATLGQDRYLLTNPPGLRMMNQGLVAEIGGRWRSIAMRASFMAVKSRGATSPGNAVIENDSGVVGALMQDPNTAVNATGRTYFDRAYVGKVGLVATLPSALGRIEVGNTADYLDGLVFGRRLLVAGLPQGPFLVAATLRGSPEGGHRAEYALAWNLRLSRTLRIPGGSLRLALDIFNVPNLGNKVQELDASGPFFNLRLPAAIQSPRFARLNIAYDF